MRSSHSESVDHTDWQILNSLRQNARASCAELGQQASLSAPATARRIRRLEEIGVIWGYRTQIDYQKFGYALTVFIQIEIARDRLTPFTKFLSTQPQIIESYRISGRDSFLLKAVARSSSDLDRLNKEIIRFGQPNTSLVISQNIDMLSDVLPSIAGAKDNTMEDNSTMQCSPGV